MRKHADSPTPSKTACLRMAAQNDALQVRCTRLVACRSHIVGESDNATADWSQFQLALFRLREGHVRGDE
jgi:hypothetical protein